MRKKGENSIMKREFSKISEALKYLKESEDALKKSKKSLVFNALLMCLIPVFLKILNVGLVISAPPLWIMATLSTGLLALVSGSNVVKTVKGVKKIKKERNEATQLVSKFSHSLKNTSGVLISRRRIIENPVMSKKGNDTIISLKGGVCVAERLNGKALSTDTDNGLNSFLLGRYLYEVETKVVKPNYSDEEIIPLVK